MEGPIAQVIINETDPEFKENVHSIIYELNKISPSLLVQILPILERDIKVSQSFLLFFLFSFSIQKKSSLKTNLLDLKQLKL